jgi:hypothetical protein
VFFQGIDDKVTNSWTISATKNKLVYSISLGKDHDRTLILNLAEVKTVYETLHFFQKWFQKGSQNGAKVMGQNFKLLYKTSLDIIEFQA